MGIADVLSTNAINGYRACLPKNVAAGQAKDVVKRFLALHPELRHLGQPGWSLMLSTTLSRADDPASRN
jgi:hypothetical protein